MSETELQQFQAMIRVGEDILMLEKAVEELKFRIISLHILIESLINIIPDEEYKNKAQEIIWKFQNE